MLKNYKELNVWQKSYKLCLEIYKVLDSLDFRIFEPSCLCVSARRQVASTNRGKNFII